MTANPWFRMYHEFATDPKVQMLCEVDQRRYIMLLCLRCCNGDVTLQDESVTFQLRISNDEWIATKARLLAKNLIDADNKPVAWEKRQYVSDSSKSRVSRHRAKKKQECNVTETAPESEADTEAEVSTPKAPKGADDDMPSNVKPVSDWSVQFATPDHSGVKLEADRLVLVNGTLARWLEAFDNDKAALDLALIEARGSVQPNSRSHTLSAQVERQLARIVAKRRDQDRRYAAAAARNIKTKADQPKVRTVSDVLREQIAAAKASETLQ